MVRKVPNIYIFTFFINKSQNERYKRHRKNTLGGCR